MKFLPLIWRNAVRNRLRTILTLAGIAFLLFVLIFVMTGLSEIQAWEGVAATHRRVVVQHAEGLMAELPIELENFRYASSEKFSSSKSTRIAPGSTANSGGQFFWSW